MNGCELTKNGRRESLSGVDLVRDNAGMHED